MGLQQVKEEILDEAEEQSAEIKEEAEKYRDEKLEEAEKKADKILEDAEAEVEEEKKELEKKKISNARMDAKRKKLDAQKEEINKLFSEFEEEIQDISTDDAKSMLENAVEVTSFDVGKVIGSSEFEDAAESNDLDFEEHDKPGFILVSEDEERRSDYSFNKIFREFEENHRKQVADKLFK